MKPKTNTELYEQFVLFFSAATMSGSLTQVRTGRGGGDELEVKLNTAERLYIILSLLSFSHVMKLYTVCLTHFSAYAMNINLMQLHIYSSRDCVDKDNI